MTAKSENRFTLYWSPGACARVTLVALNEIGVDYESRVLARGKPGEMERYEREVNPKGKVPALLVGDRVLTETPAIQIYLHGAFPDARLLPDDPDGYLDAVILMSWFAAGIHPMINKSRFPMFSSSVPESFASIKEIALGNLRDCFGQIETRLSDDREWLFDRWTIVDAYLLWLWFRGMGSGLASEEFPLVNDLAYRCQERPKVTAVLDRETEEYETLRRAGFSIPNPPPLQAGWLPPRN